MTQDPQTRRRFMRRSGAALTAVGTASLASTTVSAQTDEEDDRSLVESIELLVAGFRGEAASGYERAFGERSDAATTASEAQSEFNDHAGEWVTYVNDHSSLSGDIQVVALQFAPAAGEDTAISEVPTETVSLVADHDGDQYTSAEIVDQTDREIDETVVLRSIAADNAADEIKTAYDDFVAEDKPPAESHLAYLAGKYRFGTQHITTTILGDDLETA